MKNKLPNVNNNENFLAFNSNTGMNIADNEKHKIPIQIHIPNPTILWKRV